MPTVPAGWPCADLPADPPSVADALASPTADGVLPQALRFVPRGPAWRTDEVAAPGRPSFMGGWWRAISGAFADAYGAAFQGALQAYPSAITYSLAEWETDLGLPDPCSSGGLTVPQRVAAVRARFAATGGSSIAYFVCVAAAAGYDVGITEWDAAECNAGGCGEGPGLGAPSLLSWWFVTLPGSAVTWAECNATGLGEEGLGSFSNSDVFCLFERLKPQHSRIAYLSDGAVVFVSP